MHDNISKVVPSQQLTQIPKERLTREMREILQRNSADQAQARKELSALLTKYKRSG
jgi:hypothetical protein